MQDFGHIKTIFNDILIEGIVKKEEKSRKLFKKYLKTIKESQILKTQFLVYNNIETRVDKDFNSASIFVNENIKLLKKFKSADVVKENEKLLALLNGKTPEIQSNALYESISYLAFTEPNPINVHKLSAELKNVIDYVINNEAPVMSESIGVPNSMLLKLMLQKYNEKYADMSAADKEIVDALNTPKKVRQDMYKKTMNECLTIVEGLVGSTANGDELIKLNRVKAKLLEESIIKEDQFEEKIVKLIQLKNNLI